MCRNIKTVLNFEPPFEIRKVVLLFVRKLNGFSVPLRATARARSAERFGLSTQLP
jgi:hypothetical protein